MVTRHTGIPMMRFRGAYPPCSPAVYIAADVNPFCVGETVTFTPTLVCLDDAVSYSWIVESVEVSTSSDPYSTNTLVGGNRVILKVVNSLGQSIYSNMIIVQEKTEGCEEPGLELTFDNISNVPVADALSVSDWNAFFDLPTNGTPFTSVDVDVNMVRLSGGGNIFINGSIFYGTENPLISIVDNSGVITSVSDFCFASNWNITLIKLKALITAGMSSFIECKNLKELRLDALDSCGVACFGQLYDLETLYIPVVSDLGGTTGDDMVFFGLYTGENTNNITITVPAALMTCNGGNPDGDIQYLQANNTVTIITV